MLRTRLSIAPMIMTGTQPATGQLSPTMYCLRLNEDVLQRVKSMADDESDKEFWVCFNHCTLGSAARQTLHANTKSTG